MKSTSPHRLIGAGMVLPIIMATTAEAFIVPKNGVGITQNLDNRLSIQGLKHESLSNMKRSYRLQMATVEQEEKFDDSLTEKELKQAVDMLKSNPELELTRERWNKIFDAIETNTAEADEQSINTRNEQALPLLSKARKDMSDMYSTLKDQDHLRLFGSMTKETLPAGGSHTVLPSVLEKITDLSMTALTPKPSNTLLYAGVAAALLEGAASVMYGINLNMLVIVTIAAAVSDRILLNGAISETIVKILAPETQRKITRHEAGHFLCAYLLGCPVEGYVLSAWAALQDARFGTRAVSAGTSFFDPILSEQIESTRLTRSTIDRYSIIVMAGIAAEATTYGRADGGAGDEMALINFLLQLNGGRSPSSPVPWNEVSIRNQARWGALQAVLIIREYQECYDALVDALERGGSLADCIFAIENAGRESGKGPLKKPLGYIHLPPGADEEEWVTELPGSQQQPQAVAATAAASKPAPLDAEESLASLREYKATMQTKLKEINDKLASMDD